MVNRTATLKSPPGRQVAAMGRGGGRGRGTDRGGREGRGGRGGRGHDSGRGHGGRGRIEVATQLFVGQDVGLQTNIVVAFQSIKEFVDLWFLYIPLYDPSVCWSCNVEWNSICLET